MALAKNNLECMKTETPMKPQLHRSLYGRVYYLLSEISDKSSESFPNCRNIAQNFRRSFRRSASACRFVMVRAEYLSPGNNLCPYPTYGWCFSECQPSKYFVHRTALSNGDSR